MPRALLSVSDKSGIIDLGRGLVARGFELVSTGGTANTLAGAVLPVTNVSDVTGFPEMMDGRLKTLHPKIHGGLLARRDHPDDLAAAARHGTGLIDVVIVNLYPFAAPAKKPDGTFDERTGNTDIGGPAQVALEGLNLLTHAGLTPGQRVRGGREGGRIVVVREGAEEAAGISLPEDVAAHVFADTPN